MFQVQRLHRQKFVLIKFEFYLYLNSNWTGKDQEASLVIGCAKKAAHRERKQASSEIYYQLYVYIQ